MCTVCFSPSTYVLEVEKRETEQCHVQFHCLPLRRRFDQLHKCIDCTNYFQHFSHVGLMQCCSGLRGGVETAFLIISSLLLSVKFHLNTCRLMRLRSVREFHKTIRLFSVFWLIVMENECPAREPEGIHRPLYAVWQIAIAGWNRVLNACKPFWVCFSFQSEADLHLMRRQITKSIEAGRKSNTNATPAKCRDSFVSLIAVAHPLQRLA